MSYSFKVRGATKALAMLACAAAFAEVAKAQTCHERDKTQALAAAQSAVDLVTDDDTKDVSISMNGYLTGQWTDTDVTRIESASIAVAVYLVPREPAPT